MKRETSDAATETRHIIAIDPGRDKCGVAVVAFTSPKVEHRVLDIQIVERKIAARVHVLQEIESLVARFPAAVLVLGNSTGSRALHQEIVARFPEKTLHQQDETGSTLEARDWYWRVKPPRGWRKVWPLSLQNPPEPIDDFAAVVLAHRFLQNEDFAHFR